MKANGDMKAKQKKNKESQQTKGDVNYIQMNNLSFNYFRFS